MAKRRSRRKQPKQVESLQHQDTRANIPTNELRGFVVEKEGQPDLMLYPRDPSLDPQLVWQGKDEQDSDPLAVPIMPIYIQEKIHPQVIVEEVKRQAKADAPFPQQMSLFDDFNGIDTFEHKVEFYQHQQHWTNRMILGDSLQVMTSLAEKEGLKGKVQMIYLDPPYGIKFGSNWQVSTRKRRVQDGRERDLTRQPEQVRAFRDTWEKGIHSYLAYLRERLYTSLDLLTESGSVFVQIGLENVHLVRCLLDEVFGSDNFCSQITFFKTTSQTSSLIASTTDHILWYAKNKNNVKYRQLYWTKSVETDEAGVYRWLELEDGTRRRMTREEIIAPALIPENAKVFRLDNMTSQSGGETTDFGYEIEGETKYPGKGFWKTNYAGVKRLDVARRVVPSGKSLAYIRYMDDFPAYAIANHWNDTGTGSFTDEKVYVVQTGTKVIQRCMLMSTDPGDLVLDPTMGSGTTAYVAEEWGRRWIMIDTSRVSLALARTRLISARYPFYTLADSQEGIEAEAERTKTLPEKRATSDDIRHGFVYERAPHIMLSDISRNEEIDEIYESYQGRLSDLHQQINDLLAVEWEEWEIPREIDKKWDKAVVKLLEDYWYLRQERQQAIDDSIARNSENEILYDRPYEDNTKVRVTGAFTVESLSPHRFLSADDMSTRSASESTRDEYATVILENLKASGVQNTFRDERLVFDTLDTYPGEYIHAVGTYTDASDNEKRVAIFIGSEHGTVSPEQVQESAKEAVKGIGFDMLVVCGFAFDPHVSEEAKRYGNLNVLIARMNPDLAMGADLKTTQTGNLFMVFGEPDISVHEYNDGKIAVEIHGLDIYDPTTGQVRQNSVDDIACWFIDTDYDQESFFVRHAYFTGAGEPYDQLKRSLRAEIDEEAWSMLYRTESMPFDRPDSGKIAVKVINHYGDEVLKVYEV